ncbi:MAG: chromosomal replication initiator protein DnaA, partial [Chloroflexi bacterium]
KPPHPKELPPLLTERRVDEARSFSLHPDYTFETFIVGPANKLAYMASLSVAEGNSAGYNPLFIYGGVGLGKTHLLHAIGHRTLKRRKKALYVSSEDFTNDLIHSIRNKRTGDFRQRYRTVDILLIDDIQFLAGKEGIQEEFFHTFNALFRVNKQIVISSDRPPKAIHPFEERLRSRFEGGLIVDIQPPDLQTRLAILKAKAAKKAVQLPEEVLEFIALQVKENIRELEGALNRVVAFVTIMDMPPTVDTASLALKDLLQQTTPSPEEIIRAVAEFYNLSPDELKSNHRSKTIALARQMAMYLLREEGNLSFPQIGKLLGGRNHTTVLHGCEKIARLLETDVQVNRQMTLLREHVYKYAKTC